MSPVWRLGLGAGSMRPRGKRYDPVTPEVRLEVMRRDGECVLKKRDLFHQCRDQWGAWHDSRDVNRLSLEHVKDELRAGVRAPSDVRHLVALCHTANLKPPSKAEREFMREYLAGIYTLVLPGEPLEQALARLERRSDYVEVIGSEAGQQLLDAIKRQHRQAVAS